MHLMRKGFAFYYINEHSGLKDWRAIFQTDYGKH